MKPLPIVFLVVGLLFPVISLLTGIASLIERWKRKKHSSPVFIPVIGPALLTAWVVLSHYPFWLVPVVWVGDIGTMAFLIMSPRLISEWWDTCFYTRILNLHGTNENQSAQLSFHATGRYLLRKKWQRPPDDVGIVSLGELGSFTRAQDMLEMKADHGWSRQLITASDGRFRVSEDKDVAEEHRDYSIAGWEFEQEKEG